MLRPALFLSVGACFLASVAVVWAALADEPRSMTVPFPHTSAQTFDQALREAITTVLQQMMPPYDEDRVRKFITASKRETDTFHDAWLRKFDTLSRQVTTAQKLWHQASNELGDAREKESNLRIEISKKNREYREAQEIDAEYQRQIATASKWQIVVPFDVTYPWTMSPGEAIDRVQQALLEQLIELGRGVHIHAVDVVEQGALKQSIVIADVSGKLIPEGDKLIWQIPEPNREKRHLMAVRTYSVLPLLPDEQLKIAEASKATADVILNNHLLYALDLHDKASLAFIAQSGAPRDQEIRTKISSAMEHNKKTGESVAQILKDWEKTRPAINVSRIKDEVNKAEESLKSEQAKVAILEEKEKKAKAEKKEMEEAYKAHLDEFRFLIYKAGEVNVGELDVGKATFKKILELYEALELEAKESKHKNKTRVENFALAEESIQQKFGKLRLLELKLLPIGSRINAEGQEIISLTLLGTYGLSSTDNTEGAPNPPALSPTPGISQEQPQAGPTPTQKREPEARCVAAGAVQDGQQRIQEQLQELGICKTFDKKNSCGEVRQVQQKLQALGFVKPGSSDGVFGLGTATALCKYQERHALAITGWPDEETRRSLESQEPPRPVRPPQPAKEQRRDPVPPQPPKEQRRDPVPERVAKEPPPHDSVPDTVHKGVNDAVNTFKKVFNLK